MAIKINPVEIEYKRHPTKLGSQGRRCNTCGAGTHHAEPLERSERVVTRLKAEVDGLLRPDEVAAVRKRLRLSQRQAGELLGGGPRAFQKYESGQVMVSAAMSNLLRLLDNDPKRVEELRASA